MIEGEGREFDMRVWRVGAWGVLRLRVGGFDGSRAGFAFYCSKTYSNVCGVF